MRRLVLHLSILFWPQVCSAACPPGSIQGLTSVDCYVFGNDYLYWYTAEDKCEERGGHLVSVKNAFVNDFIVSSHNDITGATTDFWLGATNGNNGIWQWTDGETFSFSNWDKGQPGTSTNRCLYASYTNARWLTSDCDASKRYVCKVPPLNETEVPVKLACPSEWIYFDFTQSCYRVYSDGYQQWTNAEQQCQDHGAHLVSIHSYAEQHFVQKITRTGVPKLYTTPDVPNSVWTGLNSVNHSTVFEWTDGSKVDYVDWGDQRPTVRATAQTCVALSPDYFPDSDTNAAYYNRWNNFPTTYNSRVSVCKMPVNS